MNRTRRRLIWTCIWGYLGVNFLMFLRFFFPRALFEPPTVFTAGYVSDYSLGVDQRYLQSERCWVVREPGRLFVIFAQCTHLGCTPDWVQSQNIFHCPCHGSEYDSEGVNFAGPAPRPMDRCHIILDPSNQLVVDTSQRYIMDPAAGTNQFNETGAFIST
ncbi:MAG TPA: ubiquinol-cytochrome c reductase iron-sulfur subunit [Candidatus Dormibacteraeota bacterium]|nr:ubiquinol-cytochrome c reductase iron-sulfur subunit [Candidatus Dormibacteraeota bacterium]